MKNRIVTYIAVLLIFFITGISTAFAQGFKGILEKLDQIEKQLNRLETSYKQDIANLQRQVSRVQPGEDVTKYGVMVASLQSQIDLLSKDLKQVYTYTFDSPENPEGFETKTDYSGNFTGTKGLPGESGVIAEQAFKLQALIDDLKNVIEFLPVEFREELTDKQADNKVESAIDRNSLTKLHSQFSGIVDGLEDLCDRINKELQGVASDYDPEQSEKSKPSPVTVFAGTSSEEVDLPLSRELEDTIQELKAKIDELDERSTTLEDLYSSLSSLEVPAFLGFFDISASDFSSRANPWAIGPFELDLEYGYGENFAGGGAFVFEDGAVDLGVAFIDFHKYDSKISARGRIFYDPGFHFQIGRFDIPFGLDYNYFATPDRETITSPLITDKTMDGGWNDAGVRIYGTHSFVDFTAFTVNGFDDGLAHGGRIGLFPLRNPYRLHNEANEGRFGIGISYAQDLSKKNVKEQELIGFDVETVFNSFEFRGEYIKRKNFLEDVESSGYYLTAKYILERFPVYGIVHYDELNLPETDKLKRLLFGISYVIAGHSLIKVEFGSYLNSNIGEDEDKKTFSAKLVLTF